MTQWLIFASDLKDDTKLLSFCIVYKDYKREGILSSLFFDYKINET